MTLFLVAMDARVSKFDVQPVYSLGDQFMVVSGMPKRNGSTYPVILNPLVSKASREVANLTE